MKKSIELTSKLLSDAGGGNIRLDKFLSTQLPDLSRTQIQKMITDGLVQVDQFPSKASMKLEGIKKISYTFPDLELEPTQIKPEAIELNILFEDEMVIAINKPPGMVVHPGVGRPNGTLVNGLVYYFDQLSDLNGKLRPGIVHRLDVGTSGVILIAKNNTSHANLASQFEKRTIKKEYYGITWGLWKDSSGEINGAIKRKRTDPTIFQIDSSGREASTRYQVLNQGDYISSVAFYPKTGRTHQIRVHSASMHHPIFGDNKYGGGSNKTKGFIPEVTKRLKNSLKQIARQALHAKRITFIHPETKKEIDIEAPIPTDIKNIQDQIHGIC